MSLTVDPKILGAKEGQILTVTHYDANAGEHVTITATVTKVVRTDAWDHLREMFGAPSAATPTPTAPRHDAETTQPEPLEGQ